jgi:ParB family transcriptional regulator, chromosome partitioning protein
MSTKKSALGRGLKALLEDSESELVNETVTGRTVGSSAVPHIPVAHIVENPFQPRVRFETQALAELAQSIKEHGLIQPVTVKKVAENQFQLISGERRLRASKIAGLTEIPAYVRTANDESMLEMALVENIQREDLDAVEIAISFKRLLEECNLTQDALSEKVGKNRSTISNYLRLLKLPAPIQAGIIDKKISMGHARAIINIDDEEKQLLIYSEILKKDLSVRQVEQLVREAGKGKNNRKSNNYISDEQSKLCNSFSQKLNTTVEIKKNRKGKGSLLIPFSSDEELNRILFHLVK